MLCREISRYLDSIRGLPFFYFVGDEDYLSALEELKQIGLKVLRVSEFCNKDDKFPDIDSIVDCLHTLDIDYTDNKFVVIGLGEYLALKGQEEARQVLRRLKNTTLGNARVVLLLRGVVAQGNDLVIEDARLTARELVCFSEHTNSNITVENNKLKPVNELKPGIKYLLQRLEKGESDKVQMNSKLDFGNSSVPIIEISNAYTALVKTYPGIGLWKNLGNEEQWNALWDMHVCNPDKLEQGLSEYLDYEQDIYKHILQNDFKTWFYFLNLKLHKKCIKNHYLSYVVGCSESFDKLKENILIEITRVSHTDREFIKLYEDRKKLVKSFPESEIAIFVNENKVEPDEEIYKYTDNTVLEKREIISWVSKNGWNNCVAEIYPALGMYLEKYFFNCGSVSTSLTEYFNIYKQMKIENRITDEFMMLVCKHAKEYTYTKLQTRDSAINKITEKNSTYLYWIDALGVEYLSYFVELAKERGLSIEIDIARADLPTITSANRGFYENWTGLLKYKEEALDDAKHKEKGGFFYTENQEPVHLVKELEIIEKTLDVAKTSLAMHECRKFVIASDHGASRLAVIRRDEKKHPTDTQGEHSGRCCRAYDEADMEYVIEENGYFVRSDYGRYKGSRSANVEVHGGASLEEIVVPIITLKLKTDALIDIRVINETALFADRHMGTTIELYISVVENQNDISVVIEGNKYKATVKDKTHYIVAATEIKRQKECSAEVFDGNSLIGKIELKIKGRTASVNTDFDDLF
jgi:hypothetical protein